MDSRMPNPPRTSFSSILVNADWRISRAAYHVITWLSLAGLMALGVLALVMCYTGIFEYQDGWYDLSLLEWSFIALSTLLIVRLFKLTRRSGACWSYSLNTLLKTLGSFVLIDILLIAFAALADEVEPIGALQRYFQLEQLYGPTIWLGIVCLALYVSAPPFRPRLQEADGNMTECDFDLLPEAPKDNDDVKHEPLLPEVSELNVLTAPSNPHQNKDVQ